MTSELKSMFGENCPEQTVQPQQNTKKELEKKNKDYMKKQTGLKRELWKLIGGGAHSILERKGNKNSKGASNWVWAQFTNPARTDSLKLVHWQRAEDVNKDYDFARLNQNIDIVEFTKEEYDTLIKPNDRNWNYEQTCYLWDLIKRYELRFIVIMDRFDEKKYGERTVESLKDRYYSVARTILENRKMFDHPIIKSGYNYDQEMKRRTYLEKTMNKSFAELKEESNLFEMSENHNQNLNELKAPNFSSSNQPNASNNNTIQIPMTGDDGDNSINGSENKIINNNAANTNEMLNSNNNPSNKINEDTFYEENDNNQTFEDYLKYNITRNDSFVYLRSQKMKHNLPVCEKIQERVNNYLTECNFEPQKLIPTAKVEMAYDNLRNNVILYTSLKKYLDKKEKEYAFLQKKFQDYQQKKQPSQIQNQMPIPSHSQAVRNVQRSEKNLPLSKSLNPRTQNEIKDQEQSLNPQAKNIQNMNNAHVSINNSQKVEEISMINNVANSTNVDTKNTNQTNNINANNEQQDNKQNGHKEKRKRIQATPKAKKRKNANDEEVPDEEKEPKSNSKKKKKGTK